MYVHDDGRPLLGRTLKGKSRREMEALGPSASDEGVDAMSADDVGINPRGADRAATALEVLADRALTTMGFLGSSGQGWLDGVEHDGGHALFSRLLGHLDPARPQPPHRHAMTAKGAVPCRFI